MPDGGDAHVRATMPRGQRARRWLLMFVSLLVLLTHVPNPLPRHGAEPEHWDKLAHFGLYATLAVLALRTLTLRRGAAEKGCAAFARCVAILLCVMVFGLLDEATQPFTGRDFDWFDWLADGAGAFSGIVWYEVGRRRRIKLKRNSTT